MTPQEFKNLKDSLSLEDIQFVNKHLQKDMIAPIHDNGETDVAIQVVETLNNATDDFFFSVAELDEELGSDRLIGSKPGKRPKGSPA